MIPEFTLHDRSLANVRNIMSHKRQISHDLLLVENSKKQDHFEFSKSIQKQPSPLNEEKLQSSKVSS